MRALYRLIILCVVIAPLSLSAMAMMESTLPISFKQWDELAPETRLQILIESINKQENLRGSLDRIFTLRSVNSEIKELIDTNLTTIGKETLTHYSQKIKNNALIRAISKENMMSIQLLIAAGAPINQPKPTQLPSLHLAVLTGNIDIIQLLLEKGAHINIRDRLGKTPIYEAISLKHVALVQLLLNQGASLRVQDIRGNTPLQYAIIREAKDIIPILIEHGAPLNIENKAGKTALELARGTGLSQQIINQLEQAAQKQQS